MTELVEPAPQDLAAEENILGAMLMSQNAIAAVSDVLEPGDFYRESHGRIYRAAVDMYAAGDPVDAITLIDALLRRGDLEGVGGKVRIHELARLVPASANARHYAGIVKQAALRRSLIDAGHYIAQLGWEGDGDLQDQAEEIVLALAPKRTTHETVYTALEVVAGFREKVERSKIIETEGIPTPYGEFLGRLKGSRLYVLAGYTSHGKSAAAVQFIRPPCQAGKKVLFVTNEMSEPDLTARLVSTFGVPHHACESGDIEGHRTTVENALTEIGKWDFRIVDDESIDLKSLRRHVRLQQPDFLIIDHLHRFDWKERRDIERIIRGITNLAREFDIPVLLLAQLSRTGDYKNPFPKPSLPQLRETSILEQEAWAVWFIWRKTDNNHQPGDYTEFLVSKNRGGMLKFAKGTFESQFVRFSNFKEGVAA